MLTVINDRSLFARVRRALEPHAAGPHAHNEQRAYAQEVLDDLLPPACKAALLPLLTEDLRNSSLPVVRQGFPTPDKNYTQWLHTLGNASQAQLIPWTKACALYAAGNTAHPDDRRIATMLSTIEKVIHLKSVSIFTQLPDHMLANIATVLETVEYLPDQVIFQKGAPGDAMYVIVSGEVRISDNGHSVEHLGKSSIFGELALLDNEPRSASVMTTEDTLLLRLPAELFDELLEDYGAIARGILTVLSQRLRACTHDLGALHRQPQRQSETSNP